MKCGLSFATLAELSSIIQTGFHSFSFSFQTGNIWSHFRGFVITHTIRHTVRHLWTIDHLVAEASTYTGQHNIQTQETNIHAPSEIQTRDPSNQAAADLRLRRLGHWGLGGINFLKSTDIKYHF
jgi:hypothetical protein